MTDISITEAKPSDLPMVLELYLELHPDDPRVDSSIATESWARILATPNRVVLLAWHGAHAIGSLEYTICANLTRNARPYVLIENVVVAESFRRRGLASRMIKEVRERTTCLNAYKIQLAVDRAGPVGFYEACGFKATGLVMKLDLSKESLCNEAD